MLGGVFKCIVDNRYQRKILFMRLIEPHASSSKKLVLILSFSVKYSQKIHVLNLNLINLNEKKVQSHITLIVHFKLVRLN